MSSWEEYKKKREKESSWSKYKKERDSENITNLSNNNNRAVTTHDFINSLPTSNRNRKTPVVEKKKSLWENIQDFAHQTAGVADNLILGTNLGIKDSVNYAFKTGENRLKTQAEIQRNRVMGSDDLTKQEKDLFLMQQQGKLFKENDNKNTYKTILPIKETKYNEKKINQIANESILDKSIREDKEKIQENIEKQTNPVLRKFAELAPSIGNMTTGTALSAFNPALGASYFTTSAAGSYMQDALDRGMTQEEATNYGAIMGLMEGATEMIVIGNLSKAGKGIKRLINGSSNKVVKETGKNAIKTVLKDYGIGIADNVMQEALIEPVSEITAGIVGGKDKANFENIGQRMLESGINGGLTSAIVGGANLGIESCIGVIQKIRNGSTVAQEELKTAVKDAGKQLDVEKMIVDSTQQQVEKYKTDNKVKKPQDTIFKEQEYYQYKQTDNQKINNLRKDMAKYWDNSQKTIDLGNTIEKIITDKKYDIRLDDSITNKKGQSVNAQIKTLENGEVEIRINPNSKNVGEFLLMHETTHAIGTQEMKDLVMDYASKNSEFNNALESLKKTYAVEDVSDEVLSDISAQLFGNQEFINNLSMQKPSIFKRIYNKIIELASKITGNSNEALFIKDLKNKWEEAYRTQNNNLDGNTRFSVVYNKDGSFNRVKITDNIFENNNNKSITKTIKDYLTEHIGEYAEIIESGQRVYLGEDLPGEYTFSKSTRGLTLVQKMAKGRATTGLKEIINNATNRKYSNYKKTKHITDAKYGFYKYDTKFSFKLKGKEQTYSGTILIRNDANGKKYLYDILDIKKIGSNLPPVASNSYKSSANIGGSNSLPTNSISPTRDNVNSDTTKYSMQEFEKNSLSTKEWSEHLKDNYKATGTRTNLEDIKLPTNEKIDNTINTELLTDEDYKVLNDIYEKEGRTEILTERRKANILEKYMNDKYTFRDSLDILAQIIINKGHFVDKLSEQTNNPELKFLYDKNLNSFAEGQYSIGVAQTDNNGKQIGKSINDIWKPIEDSKLTKEFSEYLLHKLNIDRSDRNKFVFGKEIKATDSTQIALELENKHPEFKRYAQDIKNFNHNNLLNLKEAGLITQETIDYLEKLYPYYVPILRDKDGKIFVENNEKTGTNLPIKKAIGGNSDILPIKDAMAQQVIRFKRLVNQNKLGQELSKTLKNAKVEQQADIQYTPDSLMEFDTLVEADNKGNKYYTYFENGYMQKLRISDELYESLKPSEINKLERTWPFKALQKITNIHRSLLTSSNPVFIVSNFFKDIQDGMFNSKYSSKFIKNYGKALHEITTKGKYYESYMANGGMTNTYFDYNEGIKKKRNKFVEKIRSTNEIVEQLPRLSEFISTLEDGKSLNEALYNAAEITTNFKRGGDITKAINRNGANFLNASIQGLDKQFRNFSGQNGAKGYTNLLLKATLLGVVPSVLNHILLGDDEAYEDLPENTKDLYYLFKYDDGKFIRIPKGRVLSIFGSSARRTLEALQGKEKSFDGFKDTLINQMAPNNPLEDNIFAPIIEVKNNRTWYGDDLVSGRLQKELPKNQYDETTDEFSKWIGKQLNVSPKKVNYLIDQYSGGVGDVILPMTTPQAKQNVFKDKFTTDSIMKNKNVGKFYETLEKQSQIANDSFATDEDKLQSQYLSEISGDMSDLYREKREIQMSDISNSEKTEKVRETQEKINKLAEKGLSEYSSGTYKKNSAKIGDIEYYKDGKGKWVKLTEEEKEKNKNIQTETYATYKQKIYKETQEKNRSLKNADKIQILLDSNYNEKEINAIYENYIKSENDIEYNIMKTTGINTKEYLKYKQQEFSSDTKDDGTLAGKTVNKSKQKKVIEYLNSMKITGNQRLLLYAMQGYTTTTRQKQQLANYVQGLKLDKDTKLKLYDKFNGFTVYKNGRVTW